MPEPEAVKAVTSFKAQLLRQDSKAARELVNAYGAIFKGIQDDIKAVIETVVDQQLTFAQAKKLERLTTLERQVEREVTKFSKFANTTVTTSQADAASLAQQATKATVDRALPAGVTDGVLADAGISWNTLPSSAFENFVGISGDGKPLANLLDPLGVQARRGIVQGLGEGIARGFGPRKTAALMRDRFGVPLSRALRISRTETLRAYREATRIQYDENTDIVKGWRRVATLDDMTCFACIALDGRLYATDQLMDAHVNDRCVMVPETVSYADLGIDIPADTRKREVGEDWFKRQPEARQKKMMGQTESMRKAGRDPALFTAWKDGKFDIPDMAKVTENRTWGAAATEKPLKELVA